ncbi:protein ARABIDILLO 2 [Oryza sativa Japonica Group]|jgi:hypothetical protein|uniref:Armadillo/beta-catenin repeat protein-like n=3 Tax=Oryza TaxID=4527 RepID=B9FQJ4_ORYSJ|nr:uncharacterized protein LOC9267919 [Oryza sativa Japonica Group]XP_052158109.1 uncharacterized protein LOC127775842 [Oryza glaberrima]KAB8103583.1 hypothetical protein EE612_036119 [Oryza sativa]EEE66236.1 hypothetical protein OsJ_22404 [Oryza sativa Japonica Group]KAF2928161.1 hypothetical protein DAI22_06g257900 [Oryza sativa Japonica Group]BAD45555.1 armadillo/beta-catenin repeat protein-like [Oryza sativa Japonica Group]BAH93690.1 Os06g0683950 [Oryza sativa Japonica Group]|eukprot:NP_001174962.1 Os06g0683950 [Oryza sativa Japonica Group]
MGEAAEEGAVDGSCHGEAAAEALEVLRSMAMASSSLTCSIPQFPAKWQSIKDKLRQLCSGLDSLCGSVGFGVDVGGDEERHGVLVQLVASASATVRSIQAMASQCGDGTYKGGRLRLRSDLDNLSSKLEAHMKQLREMASSGMPSPSQAIVAVRPSADAGAGEKMFYMRDLFSRVRIGGSVQRSQSLATIGELLAEDEVCVKIVAVDIDDGVALLTGFLESSDARLQEEAAGAVAMVASFDSYRGMLVKAGVIAPLVQLLDDAAATAAVAAGGGATAVAKERAAQALRELTENSDNVWAVCAHGGLTTLLHACGDAGSGGKLVASSFAVLRNLSRVEEVKVFMAEQGVVTELVKLSQKKEEARKLGAVELLHAMALDDADVREEAVSMGVIQSLLQLIYPDLPYSYKAREVALAAIWFFCFSSVNSIDDLISSDVLGWLLFYLNNGDYAVLECTLKILRHLSEVSEEYNRMMGRAGYLSALSSLLGAKSCRVREMAAQVLSSLLLLHPNRVIFIQDGDNLNRLLQLLDPAEGKLVAKDLILSAILSLADTNSGRKKIISSEHFSSLKELADTGDFDAKKVVKKLGTNRFQTIFSKIWSV